MKVCRICLAADADRKMFALDTQHKQLYENITGISVPPTDRIPKYICWECRHLMSKYYTFKVKAATSHCTLMEILTKQNKTAPEMHQPKSNLIRTNIFYLNLNGVGHDELEEMVTIETFKSSDHIDVEVKSEVDDKSKDDGDVIGYKNEADHIWEEETTFISYDTGEINVESEVDDKLIDYIIKDPNVKTKETFENLGSIKNTKLSTEEFNNIEIADESVENDNNIEIIEKSVVNLNDNESLNNLPGDYTDDDEIEYFVSSKSDDRISSKSNNSKNISSEPKDVTIKSKKKSELDKTLQTATVLSKEEQISKMKKKGENYNYVNYSSCFPEIPADSPHCERCDLSFTSQEAFDDHKKRSTNHADERTTKITPRLTDAMVVNGIQFAKSPRVELRKYYAPPGYPPLFGAPFKKPIADSLKEKDNSKASNEQSVKIVNSDTNVSVHLKKTEHMEEAKDVVNFTETVVGDKNLQKVGLTETSKYKFICNDCGHQFHKKEFIILHIKTKHVKDVNNQFKKCEYSSGIKDNQGKQLKFNYEKRKYICNMCNNRFTNKIILKRHKQRCGTNSVLSNTHSIVKLYSCTKCGKKFSFKHVFTSHMRTHTGEKPYSCTACNKQFIHSSNLNRHMKTHTGEKPYSCTVCNKQFSSSCCLNKHTRTHTGEKPYLCIVCNKRFSRSGNLNVHMRLHTGEKPYSCTVCNKRFNHRSNLNVHLRTHTDEKPYSCTV